jgi:hypothetical protein
MFAENAPYVGDWVVLPIGLDAGFIRNTITPYNFSERVDIYQVSDLACTIPAAGDLLCCCAAAEASRTSLAHEMGDQLRELVLSLQEFAR